MKMHFDLHIQKLRILDTYKFGNLVTQKMEMFPIPACMYQKQFLNVAFDRCGTLREFLIIIEKRKL